MDDLLTTRQVQDILKVDRITIYRMLQDGRIKGVKIGQQWRFPLHEVERFAGGSVPAEEMAQAEADVSFPTHCVQTIQDLFSEVSQIGALVVDRQGKPLTQISHLGEFYRLILSSPTGREASLASWGEFARHSGGSKFFTCHAGLHYVVAPILDQDEQLGSFLAGWFYWQPPDPREEAERVRRLAAAYSLDAEALQQAARTITVIDPGQQARVEGWPFTAARAVQSILHERIGFMTRLQQIANLTQIS